MTKLLNYPKIIILIITGITIFFAIQLPNLKMNNAVEIFLPSDHESKIANNKMEDIYGSSDIIAIVLATDIKTILTKENLNIIDSLTIKIESIKGVEEVNSVINTDYIEGNNEGMLVAPLYEEKDPILLRQKLRSWDIYRGNLYSEDFKATMMTVKLKKDLSIEDQSSIYFAIKTLLLKNKDTDLKFHIAGSPSINVLMGNNMEYDLKNLIPFVILVVVISLLLSFKRLGGVALPSITVIVSTVWTLGIMSLLGINLTMVSTVIPVLLVAVGSAYGIHIISHYYDDIDELAHSLDADKHHELVISTIKKVGQPVAIAGLTTMVGFGSLATSDIVPIKEFGIFTAIGVFTALLVAVTLIPSILLLRGSKIISKSVQKKKKKDELLSHKLIVQFYTYISQRSTRIIILGVSVTLISFLGIRKIVTDSVLIEMFKYDTDIRVADRFANKNFNGTNILNILIKGEKKGDMLNPEILIATEQLSEYLKKKYKDIGKVTSFADFIRRMNQVMHYPQTQYADNNLDEKNNLETSSFEEETSSFEEETSSFEEETSSFEEETSSFEEETSSFEEETSSFEEENKVNHKNKNLIKLDSAPKFVDASIMVNYNKFVKIMNKAILKSPHTKPDIEDIMQQVAKEINYNGEAYNEIPAMPSRYNLETNKDLQNLISQYLLLYSGNLDDLIDNQLQPRRARMLVQIKTDSNILIEKIKNDIQAFSVKYFPKGYQISICGHADMALSVNNLIVSSQLRSIIMSLIIVFIIISIIYKSLIAGIYGVIPLFLSLLINFGIMGYAGIKLDIATSMVASVAIGIGVDYTVHFLAAYYHERKKQSDLGEVTKLTLLSSGKAIIFNAISVAAGFIVLIMSNFNPLIDLGILVAITMLTSSLGAMTILPVMLNIFKPKFISK